MRQPVAPLAVGLLFTLCAQAQAVEFTTQAYADIRLVVPGQETGWVDGGLGKLRFGGGQPNPNFRFAEAVGQVDAILDDEARLVAVARLEPAQRSGVDLLEAYGTYHHDFDGWFASVKAGAFFPPFSLENTDLGWTSPYTLTPSAINSWIGDELRTIGGEASITRKTTFGQITLIASAFCCNDPAGVLIADRGWSLDDRPSGLFEEVRLPDTTLRLFHQTPPDRTPLFMEIDHRIGWYGGATWSLAGVGKAAVYYYDNDGDPAAFRDDYFAWRTKFWSVGWESHFGSLSLLAQGMSGDTTVVPRPGFVAVTDYKSAYLLGAYDLDDWRISARLEAFQTRATSGHGKLNEDGNAFTAAASWQPKDWLRLTGEVVAVSSRRDERTLAGLTSGQSDTQFQLSARFMQ